VPLHTLPSDLPAAPPGFKVVQYERDIEIDLANLSLATPIFTTTTAPVLVETREVCKEVPKHIKPQIHVETTAIPPAPFDTNVKEIPGGEEIIAQGPHGETVVTRVTELPGGGERVETRVKEPLNIPPEKITTRTVVKEALGETRVETHTKLVPPLAEPVVPVELHHHAHEGEPRKGKLGHHHHDTSLGGLLKGAFGMKHGEHTPKETM